MITINDVIKNASVHPMNRGYRVVYYNNFIDVSIVGGTSGLYGDFQDTFEVAILNRENHEFVTNLYLPENGDDIVAYMDKDDLVNLLNTIFHAGFQVR